MYAFVSIWQSSPSCHCIFCLSFSYLIEEHIFEDSLFMEKRNRTHVIKKKKGGSTTY